MSISHLQIDEDEDQVVYSKNGDCSIPMHIQTFRTSWKQARSKWISAENETALPGQEVLAGVFHESKL